MLLLVFVRIGAKLLDNSKIRHFYVKLILYHDVVRLEIHMNNACFVKVVDSLANLKEVKPNLVFLERLSFCVELLLNSI